MRKIFYVVLLVSIVQIAFSAGAYGATVTVDEFDKYGDFWYAKDIYLTTDFEASVDVSKDENGRCEAGIIFYASHGEEGADRSLYGFVVRFHDVNRADFYGTKFINGEWKGFLIAEEYQDTLKDCFVSADEGWDATTDTVMNLKVKVEGRKATVTMSGNNTGKSGTLTFDLDKSACLGVYTERDNIAKFYEGKIGLNFNGGAGKCSNFTVTSSEIVEKPKTTDTSSPSTGDSGLFVAAALAIASLGGMMLLKKKLAEG
jgi:hypothetical protein